MSESFDHARDPDEDVRMEHPDLDKAEKVDENGPAFDAAYEGLDDVEVTFGG